MNSRTWHSSGDEIAKRPFRYIYRPRYPPQTPAARPNRPISNASARRPCGLTRLRGADAFARALGFFANNNQYVGEAPMYDLQAVRLL